ncbi:MAG: NADH-quinone oxidoreductase subunit K [Caldilineaceae bacterium]|nr:NADH-quinone oxidoreductase subunit K [Caldilineaceae bacterium]
MLIPFLALLVGFLFACGAFLVMRRGEIRLILGLALLSHAGNLLLFSTGGWQRGLPPIEDVENVPVDFSGFVNPLPQALILTAIVISFGILAFVVVLINRRFETAGEGLLEPLIMQKGELFSQMPDYYESGLDWTDDDYEWLEEIPFVAASHPTDDMSGLPVQAADGQDKTSKAEDRQ